MKAEDEALAEDTRRDDQPHARLQRLAHEGAHSRVTASHPLTV